MADNVKTYNFPIEDGVPMYGATMKDELGPLHYVLFHSNNAKVTKLGPIDETDNGTHMRNLRCGAFCGDKYYGFLVNVYSYTEEVKSWGTVDWNKGEFNVIFDDYTKADRVSWPIMYEMTYDNTNKVCYALGRNMDGLFVSDLYKIDLTDGSFEMLCTLDFYAWAMACDYEGNLYMIKGIPDKNDEFYAASSIVRIDTKDNYAEKDEKRIKVNGKDFIPNYTHTMEFDHNSNRLYWLGMSNDGWQHIYELDEYTGNAVDKANLMYNMVSGLYIPYKGADSRQAAGKVTDIKGEPAADGSMKAAITWKNPTQNWKGDDLEALKSVSVSRGTVDNVIATLDAANGMGKEMAYSDEAAEKGYNVYYVTTHRFEGEKGLTDSVRVFVGADAPGRPQNITLTAEGSNVRIDWMAPETGAHGEKFDLNSTVYEITRMPDNVVIASGIAATTFTDDKIGVQKQYSYIVKASNNEGEGLSEESGKILAGTAHPVPFQSDFSNEVCKDMWTSVDNNFDGIYFEWAGGVKDDFNRFQLWLNNQFDADDYLITPPIATKKGAQYRVSYTIQLGRMEDMHKFDITVGNAPTAEAQTIIADSHDNVKCESYNEMFDYETTFIAPAEVSYVGMHCMSYVSNTGSYFALRNMRIEEVFAHDLGVLSLTGSKDMTCGSPAEMTVKVRNFGSEAASAYRVEVIAKDAEGNISVIGQTECGDVLEAGKSADVKVMATAQAEGSLEIAARVVYEGDQNDANNATAFDTVNVNPAGTSDWNITVNAGKSEPSTTDPMNFYNIYSTTEYIYLKDEIKAEKDGKITRIAFQYSDNSLAAETDECDVKIYMTNTDRDAYDVNVAAEDWTPLSESTLVCEKSIKIVPGKDNLLVFDLDTPFEYDHTKNLSIQVWKEGSLAEMFPALFDCFNFGYEVYRGLRYNSNKPFDIETSKGYFPVNNVPVLHMAVDFENHSGIFEVNGDNGMSFENGVLALPEGIAQVTVYDATGAMVYAENVNATSVRLSLGNGLYIVRAVDCNGVAHVMKVTGK